MSKFKGRIIRFLGLPGSWAWAVKQMKKGKTVYRNIYRNGSRIFRRGGNDGTSLLTRSGCTDNGNWRLSIASPDDLVATDWEVLDD